MGTRRARSNIAPTSSTAGIRTKAIGGIIAGTTHGGHRPVSTTCAATNSSHVTARAVTPRARRHACRGAWGSDGTAERGDIVTTAPSSSFHSIRSVPI